MEIIEVNSATFGNIIPEPFYIFGKAGFASLNSSKAESVHYLLFKEGKYRLGLIGGIRDKTLLSPFSAPFGGFVYLNPDVKIYYMDESIQLLIKWAHDKSLRAIDVFLPPAIYHESFIAKQINSLYRAGFINKNIDLNYSFKLQNFTENYPDHIWRNARKNLLIAFKQNLEFKKCNSAEEKHLAYEVIRKNRISKGFPLRMSWFQMQETTKLIQADSFLVFDEANNPIASAIIFHVADKIVQIIYWGDIAESPGTKTMNFLAYKIFEYYKNLEIKIVDIGPSTENSIPNPGLCEFKESIGCDIQTKMKLSLSL